MEIKGVLTISIIGDGKVKVITGIFNIMGLGLSIVR